MRVILNGGEVTFTFLETKYIRITFLETNCEHQDTVNNFKFASVISRIQSGLNFTYHL